MVTGIFLLVSVAFGAITSATAILAWPAVVLTGVAFGMTMAAWTATRRRRARSRSSSASSSRRSSCSAGTFFPIEQLPDQIESVAWFTPLFHGVDLARRLAIGHDLDPVVLLIHVAVLVSIATIATLIAFRTFRRRLVV